MLREDQIDIRRQRAREGRFQIENLGKKRVFSDYRVTNPQTGGQYEVTVRGFEVGENACTCPDFKANTLGTCKHIEAVLEQLRDQTPPHLLNRKAVVTRPEVYLRYGEQLRLGLHLPPRHSDQLAELASRFFDEGGVWKPEAELVELIPAVESVPEHVTVLSDAMEFIGRELEAREMAAREAELLERLEAGTLEMGLLRVPLYPYQMRGALFCAYRGRTILGDDMGLGKTVQTLAAVELLARERGIRRVLVIAPASVKYQWESEIRKFCDRPVQVIEGGPKARARQYEENAFYRLANYEQVVRDHSAFNDWHPDVIVLDEAQRIKNWESKTSKAVKRLRSKYAIALTGTPLENRLEELYSIVQFVDDRRLGPAFQFIREHTVIDEQGQIQGYRNLELIRRRLAPILLRRTRSEVLGQLPPRTDSTIYVELAPGQREPYEQQRHSLALLLRKSYLTELDRRRILACIVNLRLICDSTYLFDKQTNVSPKLDEFDHLMGELVEAGGHKVVVFSQWETMLRKAAEVLDRSSIGYTLLHGKLTGEERKAALERFREEESCRVFLSTDAGGTGLNLQVADTVINLEVPWNPAVLEQRIARAHRMGQLSPVRVVNFVTRGSIEERVLRTVEAKKSLFAGIFEGDGDEVTFEALGRTGFLDEMREMIGERAEREVVVVEPAEDPEPVPAAAGPGAKLWRAGVLSLEGFAELAEGSGDVPPEWVRDGIAAAEKLLAALRAKA